MRAILQTGFGGREVLELRRRPEPALDQPTSVRVAVRAAGVGPWDIWRRQGTSGAGRPPFIGGYQGVGTVEAVGPLVGALAPGDGVWWPSIGNAEDGGAWADTLVADQSELVPLPEGLEPRVVAAAPLALLTAMRALDAALAFGPVQQVLVLGAASEVGHLVVQMAAVAGIRVAAVVEDPAHGPLLQGWGSERVWTNDDRDLLALAEDWSESVGVDAVFCCGALAGLVDWLDQIKHGGRLVVTRVGEPMGVWHAAFERGLILLPVNPLADVERSAAARRAALLEQGGALLGEGRVEFHLGECLDLEQVADAHALWEQGGLAGGLALRVRD